MRRRQGLVVFVSIIQSLLLCAHFVLYKTWTFQLPANAIPGKTWVGATLGILCVSFVAASLLAFRYTNVFVRTFYRAAAVWMGLLSFLFLTAVLSWIIFGIASIAGAQLHFHRIVEVCFGLGAALGLLGVFNASWTRITHARIHLENLPDVWRGRKAALISDVHLGHVRNGSFLRRMVTKILEQEPDAIFIAGDLYDGTAIDAHSAAAPLSATQGSAWRLFCCRKSRAIWRRQQVPECRSGCRSARSCAMKRLIWPACKWWECPTTKPPTTVRWRQFCDVYLWITTGPASF